VRERVLATRHASQPAWLQDALDGAVVAALLLAVAAWTILGH
jgi:hypothetical protein